MELMLVASRPTRIILILVLIAAFLCFTDIITSAARTVEREAVTWMRYVAT